MCGIRVIRTLNRGIPSGMFCFHSFALRARDIFSQRSNELQPVSSGSQDHFMIVSFPNEIGPRVVNRTL